MSDDIYMTDFDGSARLEELARKCRLDQEDEDRALSVYHGMIDAIADRVASRDHEASAPPPVIYIAAYQHRYGVDLSAHRSRDTAESRLLSIAWQQCMRDAEIRAAVDARFGPLVSEEPPLEPPFEADLDAVGSAEEGEDVAAAMLAPDSALACTTLSEPNAEAVMNGDENRSRESPTARRDEKRRTFCEKLLDEWPDFAPGEALWIVECVVEQDDELGRRHQTTGSDYSPIDDCPDDWPPPPTA